MKPCTKCLVVKPLDEFPVRNDRPSGRAAQCKGCRNAYTRTHNRANKIARSKNHDIWRRANLPKRAASLRNWNLQQREKLAGRAKPTVCECCGRTMTKPRLIHWDHDHSTGQFRGWICYSCNSILGLARDSEAHLLSAIAYLRNPPGPTPTPISGCGPVTNTSSTI